MYKNKVIRNTRVPIELELIHQVSIIIELFRNPIKLYKYRLIPKNREKRTCGYLSNTFIKRFKEDKSKDHKLFKVMQKILLNLIISKNNVKIGKQTKLHLVITRWMLIIE